MTAATAAPGSTTRPRTEGRWIEQWDPEDETFWKESGERIARRNLLLSVLSEHIGFSIWTLWSVLVLFMGPEYGIDPAGKFFLISMATLVGAVRPGARTPSPSPASAAATGRSSARSLLLLPTAAALGGDGARHLVHDVHAGRRAHRRRRRQLRLLDDQHQLLLPAAQEGLGARPERGRRQHRRARHPARRPAGHRHRRGRAIRGSCWPSTSR